MYRLRFQVLLLVAAAVYVDVGYCLNSKCAQLFSLQTVVGGNHRWSFRLLSSSVPPRMDAKVVERCDIGMVWW